VDLNGIKIDVLHNVSGPTGPEICYDASIEKTCPIIPPGSKDITPNYGR
jgi:hypothetical protein